MNSNPRAFFKVIRHPFKFRAYLFTQLPSAFFAGVRVKEIDERKCVVTVPYKWFSKNPFRSTYFACLAMAAEMSTGALALAHLYQRRPAVSMLVVKVEGDYFKKATGITRFTCEDGDKILAAIEAAVTSGEPNAIRAASTGLNEAGELVANFYITWSFKSKRKS